MKVLHLEDDLGKANAIHRVTNLPDDVYLVGTWIDFANAVHDYDDWDLIISDIMVPIRSGDSRGNNGAAAVSEARRSGYQGPIIVISGRPSDFGPNFFDNVQVFSFQRVEDWKGAINKAIDNFQENS